jgi:hypothetical protein
MFRAEKGSGGMEPLSLSHRYALHRSGHLAHTSPGTGGELKEDHGEISMREALAVFRS